jgi:hypothetical protein
MRWSDVLDGERDALADASIALDQRFDRRGSQAVSADFAQNSGIATRA